MFSVIRFAGFAAGSGARSTVSGGEAGFDAVSALVGAAARA
jgi:hypothetical protein